MSGDNRLRCKSLWDVVVSEVVCLQIAKMHVAEGSPCHMAESGPQRSELGPRHEGSHL